MIGAAVITLVLTWIPWARIGSEFMPPIEEGTILYMPTTLPGVSIARARELLRQQDSILRTFPEVAHVWGKAGRANTATDPAALDMTETTITLKPESPWRSGMTTERLVAAMDAAVRLPGVTNAWSGQYEYMERAKATMWLVVPATLALIFLLLYVNFRSVGETLIVMLSLPFALAGVAAETGVVMLIYLDHAWKAQRTDGRRPTLRDLYDAVMEGAVERVRPKMMTVTAITAGLLPILWASGTGSGVMKRIAAPMVGGMVSSTVLTLVVIPAIYSLWRERDVARAARGWTVTAAGGTVRESGRTGVPAAASVVP